jgi:hypothetical protein
METEKTLLVIYPNSNTMHDSMFYLFIAETGECLYEHLCSNSFFAYGDLYGNRPNRIEELNKRFTSVKVLFIDEAGISEEDLLSRNKKWCESLDKSGQ